MSLRVGWVPCLVEPLLKLSSWPQECKALVFTSRPLQPVAAGAQCSFQLYLIQQQSQGDQVLLVGDKMLVEQCSNTSVAQFLSRCRAHLKQPEGRKGKRLCAGKAWGK